MDELAQIEHHKAEIARLENEIKQKQDRFRMQHPIEDEMAKRAKDIIDAALGGESTYWGADYYLRGLYWALKACGRLDLWKAGRQYAAHAVESQYAKISDDVMGDIERGK
jgi:hypothetical protein